MAPLFYDLPVVALAQPIPDATTITFAVPTALQEQFTYQAGQHLIIRFTVNGKDERRSYSLHTSPMDGTAKLKVTVKRVKDGLVSNYVNDQLAVGDVLKVMVPQGRFYATVQPSDYKTYFLFAAGSGITPIYSMLTTILHTAPKSVVHLLYGNTNQETILFKTALDDLKQQFPNRFNPVHTLSDPKVWTTWTPWKGWTGRIDGPLVERFITENPPIAQNTVYFICGPGAMNTTVQAKLLELDVPPELVHIEHFGGKVPETIAPFSGVDKATLAVSLNGTNHLLTVKKDQSILQALLAANLDVRYSCQSGVCGTCMARQTKGTTHMRSNMALTDNDINAGNILTCQAHCTSNNVSITFD